MIGWSALGRAASGSTLKGLDRSINRRRTEPGFLAISIKLGGAPTPQPYALLKGNGSERPVLASEWRSRDRPCAPCPGRVRSWRGWPVAAACGAQPRARAFVSGCRHGVRLEAEPKLIPEQSPLAFFDKSKHTISGHVLGRATPVRPLWAPHTTHVPPSSLLRSIVDRCNPPSKDSNILLILQSFHYYS